MFNANCLDSASRGEGEDMKKFVVQIVFIAMLTSTTSFAGIYDLEVDTSLLSPEQCAQKVRKRLENGPRPSAFERLAGMFVDKG